MKAKLRLAALLAAATLLPAVPSAQAAREAVAAGDVTRYASKDATRPAYEPKAAELRAPESESWLSYNQGLAQAKAYKRHVMIQFADPACRPCQRMGQDLVAEPALDELVRKHFVLIRVDRGSTRKVVHRGRTLTERQLAALHQVKTFPTLLFLAPNGQLIGRHVGDLPSGELLDVMRYVSSNSYQKMEYKAYKAK